MARSKSYYEYVESANGDDLDQIKIDGQIMPLRSTADQKIMRGEDVVWLMEAVRQRLPMSFSRAKRAIDADSSPYPLVVNSVFVRIVKSSGESWSEDAETSASKFAFDRCVRAGVYRDKKFLYGLFDYLDDICSNAVASVSPPSKGAVKVLADSAKTDWGSLFSAKSVASTSLAYSSLPRIVTGQPLRLDVMKAYFAALHACTSVAFRVYCSSMATGKGYGSVNKGGAQPPSGYTVCDLELSSTSGNLAALYDSDSCTFGALSICRNTTTNVSDPASYAVGTIYGGPKSSFVLAKFKMTHVARVYGYLVMIAQLTVDGSTSGKRVVVGLGDATKDGDTFTFTWGGVASVESLCSKAGFVVAESADEYHQSTISFTPDAVCCIAEFDDHTYYEAS